MEQERKQSYKKTSKWAVALFYFVWLLIVGIKNFSAYVKVHGSLVVDSFEEVVMGLLKVLFFLVFATWFTCLIIDLFRALIRFVSAYVIDQRNNKKLANAVSETEPPLAIVSNEVNFSCAEERAINMTYREYLRAYNVYLQASAHVDFLKDKVNALKKTRRYNDAQLVENELNLSKARLSAAEKDSQKLYSSKYNLVLFHTESVKDSFDKAFGSIPNERMPLVGDFFQSPLAKVVRFGETKALVFTPGYVVCYVDPHSKMTLVKYDQISVFTDIFVEAVSVIQNDDEFARVGYLHETVNGKKDLRYNNNPSFDCVYRGNAIIKCSETSYERFFTNKSLTERFVENIKAYSSFITTHFNRAVDAVLNHESAFLQATNADHYSNIPYGHIIDHKNSDITQTETMRHTPGFFQNIENRVQNEEKQEQKQSQHQTDKPFIQSDTELNRIDGIRRNNDVETLNGVLIGWYGEETDYSIPADIATEIGAAFQWKQNLRSVVIPEGITTIRAGAFRGCSHLRKVIFSSTVQKIEEGAFWDCSSLEEINLPLGIKTISRKVMQGCTSIQTITIPKGVESIEDRAFSGCTSLKHVVIPSTVTNIGSYPFGGCSSIEVIDFDARIKVISVEMFKGLGKLTKLTVPPTVTVIYDQAFENCKSLQDISLPQKLRSIGNKAFAGCQSLKTIEIPKSLQFIGTEAFRGCKNLSVVNGIENIDWKNKKCFSGTEWLALQAKEGFVVCDNNLEEYLGNENKVQIPKTVRVIGSGAFEGNQYIETVTIPNGVTSIETRAFANCKNLVMVRIPDSVKSIEDNAFSGDYKVVIQCTRGSVASSFRIRNKLLGEYVSKTSSEKHEKHQSRTVKSGHAESMLGLSEEERRLIMEMRRKKHEQAHQNTIEETVVEPRQINFRVVAEDDSRISLKLVEDSRKITNNIFNLRFLQGDPSGNDRIITEYEAFVIDSNNQIISDIKTIITDLSGDNLTHKVTFTLSSQEKFDKNAAYYVVVRYKNSEADVLSKTKYQISVDFASDFDF